MRSKYFDAVVASRRRLTDRIVELTLKAESPPPPAEAGAHIEIRVGGRYLRHYSVVGPLRADEAPEDFYRIAVRRDGLGSRYIHDHLENGSGVKISAPIQTFRLSRGQNHTLLMAGGIGVTPIFAFARSLVQRRQPFTALYVGPRRADMAYADALSALCGERLIVRETEREGRPDLAAYLSAAPAGTVVHACGPEGMLADLRAAVDRVGFAPDRIRTERFHAAASENRGFEVRLKSGLRISVPPGVSILDALEDACVDTLSDCRRGECGLCATDVLGMQGELDHRDHVLTDAQRRKSLTICCSRLSGTWLNLDL